MARSGLSPVPPQPRPQIIIPQDVPVYEIIEEKGFFGPDDHLYKEGDIIAWEKPPSLAMRPLNALANKAYRDHLSKLDAEGRKMAERAGKHWTSLADAYENSLLVAKQEAEAGNSLHKGIRLLNDRKDKKTVMGAKKNKAKTGISKIELEKAPEILGSGDFSLDKTEVNKGL